MKLSWFIKTIVLCLFCSVELPSLAQGVIVYKKDGTQVDYPYASIDSIVTYLEKNEEPIEPQAGDKKVFTVNGCEFTMIFVKGGTFKMGSNTYGENASPIHNVTLSDYYIAETEVTQELYYAVTGEAPSEFVSGTNLPVERVNRSECSSFVKKLNELTGEKFALPTEAQWEFAARGGTLSKGYLYSGGSAVTMVGWYKGNSDEKTHPVKQKLPNELGIYDMAGNVKEWCSDWFGDYSSKSVTNPTGPSKGSYGILRGGSWKGVEDFCTVSFREYNTPDLGYSTYGFRIVLKVN